MGYRFSSLSIPNHSRFTLVGDTDGNQVRSVQTALLHCFRDHFLGVPPDFLRIVFDPSRSRVDLSVFFLGGGHNCARLVEYHKPSTGCALVSCPNVFGHSASLPPNSGLWNHSARRPQRAIDVKKCWTTDLTVVGW